MNSTLGKNVWYTIPYYISDIDDPAARIALELAMDDFPEPELTFGPNIAAWIDAELYARIVDANI